MLLIRQFDATIERTAWRTTIDSMRGALGAGAAPPRIYVEDVIGESTVVARLVAARPELATLCLDDACLSNLSAGWYEANEEAGPNAVITWDTVAHLVAALNDTPAWRALLVFAEVPVLPAAGWSSTLYGAAVRSTGAPFAAHPGELVLSWAVDSLRVLAATAESPPATEHLPELGPPTRALLDAIGRPAQTLRVARTVSELDQRFRRSRPQYDGTEDPVVAITRGTTLQIPGRAKGAPITAPARDVAAVFEPRGYTCQTAPNHRVCLNKATANHNQIRIDITIDAEHSFRLEPHEYELRATIAVHGVDWTRAFDVPFSPTARTGAAPSTVVASQAQWLVALDNLRVLVARAEEVVVPVIEESYGPGFAWFPIMPADELAAHERALIQAARERRKLGLPH